MSVTLIGLWEGVAMAAPLPPLDRFLVWFFLLPEGVESTLRAAFLGAIIALLVAPGVAGLRWAARGRTKLVPPSCRRCRSLLRGEGDAVPARCSECGLATDERRAVVWTKRGTRPFSAYITFPTIVCGIVGFAIVVSQEVLRGYDSQRDRLRRPIQAARVERSLERIERRLDEIERGDAPGGDTSWLLNEVHSLMERRSRSEGQIGGMQLREALRTVIQRIIRIARDPSAVMRWNHPLAQTQYEPRDLLYGIAGIVIHFPPGDEDLLAELTEVVAGLVGDVELRAPNVVQSGQGFNALVTLKRGLHGAVVKVHEVWVNDEPIALPPVPGGGGFQGSPLSVACTAPSEEKPCTLRVRGEVGVGSGAGAAVAMTPFDETITFESRNAVTPADLIERPEDPFTRSGGAIDAWVVDCRSILMATVILRPPVGVIIEGVVDVDVGTGWRTVAEVPAIDGPVVVRWLLRPEEGAGSRLPTSLSIRMRQGAPLAPPVGHVRLWARNMPTERWRGEVTHTLWPDLRSEFRNGSRSLQYAGALVGPPREGGMSSQ